MPALLDLPLALERARLAHLARSVDEAEVRAQALVDLMSLEADGGNELAFERLRQELLETELSEPVATFYRVQVAWGLARFGRIAAARRWTRTSR